VVEHSLGKGEAESSILSRSTSKTQGNSTLSDFPWENIALRKYGTLRENTGQNAGKLGKTRAGFQTRFHLVPLLIFARKCSASVPLVKFYETL
jgi:hypothetical protein